MGESARSARRNADGEVSKPDAEFVYSVLLKCTNPKCGEEVASTGIGYCDIVMISDEHGEYRQEWEQTFEPRMFIPALKSFAIPSRCPPPVRAHIEEAFLLQVASRESAANKVRMAIEALLTELGVKRTHINKRKRREFLALHQRIELLPQKYDAVREELLAAKWLGNHGSHYGESLRAADLDDLYTLLKHVLEAIYEKKHAAVRKLARTINRYKGPARARNNP